MVLLLPSVTLHLKNNRLFGSIPESLGSLTDLTCVALLTVGCSGSVWETMTDCCRCRDCSELGLEGNLLTLAIPQSFGSLTGLV
jgi:hypothetical protein